MRVAAASYLLGLLVLASGCGSRQEASLSRAPLFAGTLEDGNFWKNPLTAPSNESTGYAKGSRVEVYNQFVVVTTSDGFSHLHPHGYYSGLAIKKN
jgi:hypothetical protein